MAYTSISPTQIDPKSPVDDQLFGQVHLNLEDLNARVSGGGSFPYEFKVNGSLTDLYPFPAVRLDGLHTVKSDLVISMVRVTLEYPGTSGSLVVDIRKYKMPNSPITSIAKKFSAAITSIAQVPFGGTTQAVARATPQIATQSISLWKTAINISSIQKLDGSRVQLNLAGPVTTDWAVGDTVTVASATAGGNNGTTFQILEVNADGSNNLIISNVNGVDQAATAGTVSLNAWSYNFSNPVSTEFVAGEKAVFASHTGPTNNGTFTIYAVNSGGNNIVVKSSTGVAQAAAAGNVNTLRWLLTSNQAFPTTNFVVGETIVTIGHTAGNNGIFRITGVNGSTLTIYNETGVVQGAGGTLMPNRWVYTFGTNPAATFQLGEVFRAYNTTSILNSGLFTVVQIGRTGLNNLVVYNPVGTSQGAPAGTVDHTHMIYSFATDQSAHYTVSTSRIEVLNTALSVNAGNFTVLEVNRGGGSNYNVVVYSPMGVAQVAASGRIISESKSIFNSAPTMILPIATRNATNRHFQHIEITSGFSAEATVVAGEKLGMEVVSIPKGNPSDLIVQMA